MREVINYMLEANLGLLIFLAAYKLLFKNENAFGTLRIYLLASILFSLLFPLIHIQNETAANQISIGEVIPEYWLPEVAFNAEDSGSVSITSPSYNTWLVLSWIYVAGITIASIWLILQVGYVLILMQRSKSYKIRHFHIVESRDDKPTFSFFNVIYIGKIDSLTEFEKTQIIRHEMIHATRLHSLDILIITIVRNFFWFNPFLKTYKDLFIQLHEFEADARAVENSDVDKYCSLLARVALQSHFPIASHFNESLTIKRIEMMRTLKTKIKRWKIAVVLAITSTCFVTIACNDQLVDDLEKSTISQSTELPAEVQKQMQNYQKQHPDSKLTYLEGSSDDVEKFAKSPDVKGRVVYQYSYQGDEKKGILLTDVVQYAETLKTDDKVFMVVEQMPEYEGGYDALRNFLSTNIRYPKEAAENGEGGTVYVSMVIDETGLVNDTKVVRGVSSALDAEALRVVNIMPTWKPGKQNGKPVKVRYNIPIKFTTTQPGDTKQSSVGQLTPVNLKMSLQQFEKIANGSGKKLTGRVSGENGEPLSGLTVIIAGTTTGTKTNSDGTFSIQAPSNGKLVLTYVGYESQTIAF